MIDRTTPPSPEGSVSFEIPNISLIELDNGLEIFFVKKEKLPIVQTTLVSYSGSKNDPPDKKGLSFLTSLTIDEGAGKYNGLELNNEIEKLGTILNISTNHDAFSVSILSLKENYARSIELLSTIFFEPHFTEEDFMRERRKVLDRILQLKEEPSYLATATFDRLVFEKSFYAFPEIGFEKTVNGISRNDLAEFHRNNLLAHKLSAIVVGNIDETELKNLFEDYFGAYSPAGNILTFIEKPKLRQPGFYFVHKEDSAQSEIRIGHVAKDRNAPDYFAARIMNIILGGQFTSRINLNLRERRGFTYGAGSAFNYLKYSASFEVSTAVNIQNTGEAISEIINELRRIRKEISKPEIEFAKSYLVKQFPSRFETYTQIAKNIAPLLLHELPLDYYKSYTQKIEEVSDSAVLEAAVENIFPDNLIVLVVGDRNKIVPQFKKIAGSEPVELKPPV